MRKPRQRRRCPCLRAARRARTRSGRDRCRALRTARRSARPARRRSTAATSIRCASSPRRIAPAIRALPLSVCSVRRSCAALVVSSGARRQALTCSPACGKSSSASSRKIDRIVSSRSSRDVEQRFVGGDRIALQPAWHGAPALAAMPARAPRASWTSGSAAVRSARVPVPSPDRGDRRAARYSTNGSAARRLRHRSRMRVVRCATLVRGFGGVAGGGRVRPAIASLRRAIASAASRRHRAAATPQRPKKRTSCR